MDRGRVGNPRFDWPGKLLEYDEKLAWKKSVDRWDYA